MSRQRTSNPVSLSALGDGLGFSKLGRGAIGGKAEGLVWAEGLLQRSFDSSASSAIRVKVPWFWVIASDWFELI